MALAPYVMMSESPELVKLCFRFQINGTSDPDACVPAGAVLDVDRTAAGTFEIELPANKRPPTFIGATGSVMGDDGVSLGLIVQAAVDGYVAATGKLTVRTVDTYTDATPAAADPTDNDWVYIEATFCVRTSLSPSAAI